MTAISLADLPSPPGGRTGWPWTEQSAPLPPTRLDGSAWPRITIVTPSYNQGQFIEETIRSILLQGYPNLEYMVIDGGSSDNTVAILERYAPWITYWHSRKDDGQPDAINFALNRSTGHWFHNVNSDDVLLNGALAAMGAAPVDADYLAGDVLEFSDDGEYLVPNAGFDVISMLARFSRTDGCSWHQPGVILKTSLLQALGGYSTNLQYTFDHHATTRYIEQFGYAHCLQRTVMRFRIHGGQKSTAWGDVYRRESIKSRTMLANDLLTPKYRAIALREARRLEMMGHIAGLGAPETRVDALSAIASIVKSSPALMLDRMFLGSLRRNPQRLFGALLGKS